MSPTMSEKFNLGQYDIMILKNSAKFKHHITEKSPLA